MLQEHAIQMIDTIRLTLNPAFIYLPLPTCYCLATFGVKQIEHVKISKHKGLRVT